MSLTINSLHFYYKIILFATYPEMTTMKSMRFQGSLK